MKPSLQTPQFVRLDTAEDERSFWTAILGAIDPVTPGADPAAQVLALLARGDGLLILDNLDTPWNADETKMEEALARLADAEAVQVVASIRGTAWPAHVDWLRLPTIEPLPANWARTLFLQVAGSEFDGDPDLQAIVSSLDGLPLAIDLLARQAQGLGTLGNLRADFETRKSELFELGEGKDLSLKASLELSINSRKMTGAAKRMFTLMGRLPAGVAVLDTTKLLPTGGAAAGRILCQTGLAFEEQERIRMLAPIREHARNRPLRDHGNIVNHYLKLASGLGVNVGRDGGADAVARLSPEVPNIEAVLSLAIRERFVRQAMGARRGLVELMRFAGIGSNKTLILLVSAARARGDLLGEAECTASLGEIALCRSDHDGARDQFERAIALFRGLGSLQGEATCDFGLGRLALRLSDHDEARRRLEKALEVWETAGNAIGEANCVHCLGELALWTSDHDEAHKLIKAAQEMYQKLGSELGKAHVIRTFGELAYRRSEHNAAQDQFETAQRLYQKVGDIQGEAHCIFGLGEVALRRGDYDQARDRFETARGLYQKVGNAQSEANCVYGFGEIAREMGQAALAETEYLSALVQFRRISHKLGEANCLMGLGQIAEHREDLDAQRQLHEALVLFDEAHYLEGRGRTLLTLAELESEIDVQRSLLLDALDSHTRFGNPRWIGETHRSLARISDGPERKRHIASAYEAWSGIDLPNLVAELDSEFSNEPTL